MDREAAECDQCDASFGSHEALVEHAVEAHADETEGLTDGGTD